MMRSLVAEHERASAENASGVLHFPKDSTTSAAPDQKIAVYASSIGNYFFNEIRDLIVAGFEKNRVAVQARDDRQGFAEGVDVHVIVAPHEFFYLGAGPKLMEQPWPGKVVLVNTEQPSTEWFELARRCFPRAAYIWDIDCESVQRLVTAGYPCDFLPLGFVDGSEFSQPVDRLPRHYGTCFLDHEERAVPYRNARAEDRPIDVLFIGGATSRREIFFAQAAPVLSKYRCYIHLGDNSAPIRPGINTHMNTKTALGLAQRSKVLINVHRGLDSYFEWHRVVMLGIWQRALVVGETSSQGLPFEAGLDYVEAPLANLAATIDHYLSSLTGVAEAQAIIDHAYRTLTERCDLAQVLRTLMEQLLPQSQILHGMRRSSEIGGIEGREMIVTDGEKNERCA